MRAIRYIAVHVFREAVRDRVLYNLLLFAILLMAASYLLGQLTAGQDVKIIKDLGLAAANVFGLFIAVFIGIGLVSKEVERRSIYSLLSKPIRRHEFIIGKYLGLVLTVMVNIAVMAAAFYVALAFMYWLSPETVGVSLDAPTLDPRMLKAFALIAVQLALVIGIALLFSSFSSPFLSAGLTFLIYVAGHFGADLKNFESVVESKVAGNLARGVYWLLPNMAAFDVKAQVVHGLPLTSFYMLATIGYGLLYIAAVLLATTFIFSRRDFK